MGNIVITGSTRGLGFSMATEFLRAGCNVTLSGRGEKLAQAAQRELSPFEGKYIYIPCNVQEKANLQKLWDASLAQWGEIDIWINNAGKNTPHRFSWETGETDTENIIKTNLIGMIYGSQIAATGMLKQGHGAIYSMEGLGSNNMIQIKTILYGTTKHALTYFMKGLAKELKGTNVTAGRLSPGMVLTD
jgi:short-subunit dehydrogenase